MPNIYQFIIAIHHICQGILYLQRKCQPTKKNLITEMSLNLFCIPVVNVIQKMNYTFISGLYDTVYHLCQLVYFMVYGYAIFAKESLLNN